MQIVRVSLDNGQRAVGLKLHKLVVESLKEQLKELAQQDSEGVLWGLGCVGEGGFGCSSCVCGRTLLLPSWV